MSAAGISFQRRKTRISWKERQSCLVQDVPLWKFLSSCKMLADPYLIQLPHRSAGGRDGVVDKEEEGVFWPQVDPLSDQEVELPNWTRQKRRKKRKKTGHRSASPTSDLSYRLSFKARFSYWDSRRIPRRIKPRVTKIRSEPPSDAK